MEENITITFGKPIAQLFEVLIVFFVHLRSTHSQGLGQGFGGLLRGLAGLPSLEDGRRTCEGRGNRNDQGCDFETRHMFETDSYGDLHRQQ